MEQAEKKRLSEKRRMFWLLLVLWLLIGWMDLSNLVIGRSYPISYLYVLVLFPAAVVFGQIGLWTATVAVVVMYHFTNDKTLNGYTEPEVIRLVVGFLIGLGFERVSKDRERIRVALAKLQRETRVREDLTHMLVHDLRTPLTGIITSLQTLQYGVVGDLEPEQKEMVDYAVADGERLLGMVNQILDVARLESGELPLKLERINFAELADKCLRSVQPLADEGGVSLSSDCNGLDLNVDRDLIQRVILNLLGNAIKFTPRDGHIIIHGQKNGDDKALIVVEDTGKGIPAEDIVRIFDKYTQAEDGKTVKHSTGLGLTFCRLAVEAHGGRIWAESALGVGTKMNILLPLEPSHSN